MHLRLRILNTAPRIAAVTLLMAMVYQLGACSCGCLEHSVWAHFLGMESADDHHPVSNGVGDAVSAAGHDDHDCCEEAKTRSSCFRIRLTTALKS